MKCAEKSQKLIKPKESIPKTNLLFVTTCFDVGGCEKMLYELARHLDRSQYSIKVLSLKGSGEMEAFFAKEGIDTFHINLQFANFKKQMAWFRGFIEEHQIDIVHSFLFHANIFTRLACKGKQVRHISSHRTIEKKHRWHLLVDKLTKKYTHYELANASTVKDYILQETGGAAEQCRVIYNGVNVVPENVRQTEAIKKELKLDEKIVFATVGSLTLAKNHDLFIRVAKEISDRTPDVVFLIFGEGPLRKVLQSKIDKLGLEEVVQLVGFRENIRAYYYVMDYFVLTSDWEGFPNVVLEAMASRVPVVTRNVGGVAEIIHHGVNGQIAYSNSPFELVQRLDFLRLNKSLRDQYVTSAFELVSQDFQMNKMVKQYEDFYAKVIQSKVGRIL